MDRKSRSVMDSFVASDIEWCEFESQQGTFFKMVYFLSLYILYFYVFILSFTLELSFYFVLSFHNYIFLSLCSFFL